MRNKENILFIFKVEFEMKVEIIANLTKLRFKSYKSVNPIT